MEDNFNTLIDKIRNGEINPQNEQETKTAIVMQVLGYFDWNIFETKEVAQEYFVDKDKVDICLKNKSGDEEKVFIEVKHINQDLDSENHQDQLLKYSFKNGIEIAILTNGIEWWFYLPMYKEHWAERKVFSVDLLKQDKDGINTVMYSLLNKDKILSGAAEKYARGMCENKKKDKTISSTLPKTWKEIIKKPPEYLVELLKDANEKNCGYLASDETIKKFLINQYSLQINETMDNTNKVKRRKNKTRQQRKNSKTDKKPVSFLLNGKRTSVDDWADILVKTCSYLYEREDNFIEEVNKFVKSRGAKIPYVSRNKKDLIRTSRKLENINLFVYAHLGQDQIVRRSKKILGHFGYSTKLDIKF